jgi:hypothetical protein
VDPSSRAAPLQELGQAQPGVRKLGPAEVLVTLPELFPIPRGRRRAEFVVLAPRPLFE